MELSHEEAHLVHKLVCHYAKESIISTEFGILCTKCSTSNGSSNEVLHSQDCPVLAAHKIAEKLFNYVINKH